MKRYVCSVCGYIAEGEIPAECPVCKAKADKFKEMAEGGRQWADQHVIGVAEGCDPEVVEGLRANFTGECTEVGMYLAMSRQADREGFPEVAEAYKRIAFEEAEHAAKFAELLGEVVFAETCSCAWTPSRARRKSRRNWRPRPSSWATMPSTTPCTRCARTKRATAAHSRACSTATSNKRQSPLPMGGYKKTAPTSRFFVACGQGHGRIGA